MPRYAGGVTLVCGGGGVWGLAWMTGLVIGLRDAGVDVGAATAMVGTSAGSVLTSQLAGGLAIEALFDQQIDRAKQPREPMPPPGGMERLRDILRGEWSDPQQRARAACRLGLETETIGSAERRDGIVARLGLASEAWPEKPLAITAVDADTAQLCVFDAASGASLIDAVAASCAVPGVWPPMPIAGRRYVDGGVWRTAENAHLAEGSNAVLILSPMGRLLASNLGPDWGLDADVARLKAQGAQVVVVCADDQALATMGTDPLDPTTREQAAQAGRRQGVGEAAEAQAVFA